MIVCQMLTLQMKLLLIKNDRLPITVLGIGMARDDFIDGEFCAARFELELLLQGKPEWLGYISWELQASMLSTKRAYCGKVRRPRWLCIKLVWCWYWHPQALQQQHLC